MNRYRPVWRNETAGEWVVYAKDMRAAFALGRKHGQLVRLVWDGVADTQCEGVYRVECEPLVVHFPDGARFDAMSLPPQIAGVEQTADGWDTRYNIVMVRPRGDGPPSSYTSAPVSVAYGA